jgi:TldD protein
MRRVLVVVAIVSAGILRAEDLVGILRQELQRSMALLRQQPQPAYFLAYRVWDIHSTVIEAQGGKLFQASQNRTRLLGVELRVGSYELDNTHPLQDAAGMVALPTPAVELPLQDDPRAIRQLLWQATLAAYERAAEQYSKVLAARSVRISEDTVADFSREQPQRFRQSFTPTPVDTARWGQIVRRLSARFAPHEWILAHRVSFRVQQVHKTLVTSEGTELSWGERTVFLTVSARTRADDGMELPLYRSYFAHHPDELPSVAVVESDIARMIELLERLRRAPVLETYTGPAILSGEAAGVFFHEILGHRVEGERQKDPRSAQMLRDLLGQRILPEFLDVIFDPLRRELNGVPLAGHYRYDDEGIPARPVTVVERGVLKQFLTSRTPIPGASTSNGHGRAQPGLQPTARQSNLIVVARQAVSPEALREQLRQECRRQGKEFGLLFESVEGGFTFTARTIPNAFNVLPLVVYKVYADGRPDELVRGVDLIGTPLTAFANIVAAGSDVGVFNGICGAESGNLPVSASSPSLLIARIEVQKKAKSDERPPLLPPPSLQP